MLPPLVLLGHPWMERGVPSQANPPPGPRGAVGALGRSETLSPKMSPTCTSQGSGSQRDSDLSANGGTNSLGCAWTPQKHKAGHWKIRAWTAGKVPAATEQPDLKKELKALQAQGGLPGLFPAGEWESKLRVPRAVSQGRAGEGLGSSGSWESWESTTRSQHHWPQPSWHLQLQCLRCHILPRRKDFCPL